MPDPSLFDWLAQVVVPTAVGLAAIVVGVASLRTARVATGLASRLADEQRAAAAREERERLAALVFDWSSMRWRAEGPPDIDTQAGVAAARSKWSVALTQSDQPGAGVLQDVLWSLSNSAPPLKPLGYAFLAGGFHALTEDLVAQWLKDPASTDKLRKMLADRQSSLIRQAIELQDQAQ